MCLDDHWAQGPCLLIETPGMQSSVAMMTPSVPASSLSSGYSDGISFTKRGHGASDSNLPGIAAMTMMENIIENAITSKSLPTPFEASCHPATLTSVVTSLEQDGMYDKNNGLEATKVVWPLPQKKMVVQRDQLECALFLSCPEPAGCTEDDNGDGHGDEDDAKLHHLLSLSWRLSEAPVLAMTALPPALLSATLAAASDLPQAHTQSDGGLVGNGAMLLDSFISAIPPNTEQAHHGLSPPIPESRDDGANEVKHSSSDRHPSSPLDSHTGTPLEVDSPPTQPMPHVPAVDPGTGALSSSTADDDIRFADLPNRVGATAFGPKPSLSSIVSFSSSLSPSLSKEVSWDHEIGSLENDGIVVEIEWALDDENDHLCNFADKDEDEDEEWSFSTASNASFILFDDLSELTFASKSADNDEDEHTEEGDDDSEEGDDDSSCVEEDENIPNIVYNSSDHCGNETNPQVDETVATEETTEYGALHDRSLLDFLSHLCEATPR